MPKINLLFVGIVSLFMHPSFGEGNDSTMKVDSVSYAQYLADSINYFSAKKVSSKPGLFAIPSYEPNRVGYSVANGGGFMDFTASIEYAFLEDWFSSLHAYLMDNPKFDDSYSLLAPSRVAFAFNGRFGQYISDRFSAPVVEKRFNPLVFARWGSPSSWFFDLGYEHESNGQAIETPDDYNAQRLIDSTVEKEHGLKYYPTETNERISRGWDFLDFNAGATNSIFGFSSLRKNTESSNNKFSYNINLKYFLSNGLLETTPENIRAWEKQDTNMTRQRVDGITIQLEDDYVLAGYLLPWVHRKLLKYNISTVPFIGSVGGGLTYTTGVLGPFEHNTFRGELDVQIYSIPLSGYYQYGYLNEVATYYQKATTIGFGVKIPMLI